MAYLTAWYNLIFILPLMMGVLMVFGSLFGIAGDADHDMDGSPDIDADADHDVEHDADGHEAEGRGLDILAMLGIGRVPVSVVLMLMTLLFGGVGMLSNFALAPILRSGNIYGPISILVGLFSMTLLTGRAARWIGKRMPSTETYVMSRRGLIDRVGYLTVSASQDHPGFANVRDAGGTVHPITCVPTGGFLACGTQVVVVDYDDQSGMYRVAKFDSVEARSE